MRKLVIIVSAVIFFALILVLFVPFIRVEETTSYLPNYIDTYSYDASWVRNGVMVKNEDANTGLFDVWFYYRNSNGEVLEVLVESRDIDPYDTVTIWLPLSSYNWDHWDYEVHPNPIWGTRTVYKSVLDILLGT